MSVTKDKKRGTWYFSGYYRDALGRRQHYCRRGFATKKEAREAEHAFVAAASVAQPSITLDELFQKYKANFRLLGIKESTIYEQELYYKVFIKEDIGGARITKLTAPVISEWLASISNRNSPRTKKPYAVGTLNKARSVLSRLLSYAVQNDYINMNPCSRVPLLRNPAEIPDMTPNFWEVDTFKRFMSHVDDQYWHDVFEFLFGTGLRIGEFCALQWSDVNLEACKLRVNKSVTYNTSNRGWVITSPKTGNSVRTIDLQNPLTEMLKRRYDEQIKKDGFTPAFFVFGDVKPVSSVSIRNHLNKYIKISGVPSITVHGLRHSHASYLIRTGKIDDQLIADRLGHTVMMLRSTYAHIYEESRKDLKDVLNNVF